MVLSDQERRVVLALGQCLFPRDALLGVDADDAGVVAWVDDYLARMDPIGRTRIRALIRAFDLGFVAWAGRPTASFVTARPDDRAAYVASWDNSPTYTQRMLAEALRTVLTFAYVDSAVVDSALRPAGVSRSSDGPPGGRAGSTPPERRESSGEKDKASA